jgi:hypothetical protein
MSQRGCIAFRQQTSVFPHLAEVPSPGHDPRCDQGFFCVEVKKVRAIDFRCLMIRVIPVPLHFWVILKHWLLVGGS